MKSYKTAGWITLGCGLPMLASGIAIIRDNPFSESRVPDALVVVGFASSIASIVLFGQGSKHKALAKIQLQHGAVAFNNPHKYSGISISFSF